MAAPDSSNAAGVRNHYRSTLPAIMKAQKNRVCACKPDPVFYLIIPAIPLAMRCGTLLKCPPDS